MAYHGAQIVAIFLEQEVICHFHVPKYVLTNNGIEWGAKFEDLFK
jgi:hypothetical protein